MPSKKDQRQKLVTILMDECFSQKSFSEVNLRPLADYILGLEQKASDLIKDCLLDNPSEEAKKRLKALVNLFKKYLEIKDQKVSFQAGKTDNELYEDFKQLLEKWGKDVTALDATYRKNMTPSVNQELGMGGRLTGKELLYASDIDSALGQLFQFTSDKVEERYLATDSKDYYISMAKTFDEANIKTVAEYVQRKVDGSKQPYEIFIPCLKGGDHWILVKLVVDSAGEKSIHYCNSTNALLTEKEKEVLEKALDTKTIEQEKYAPVQAADSWSCGYHVVRMVAQNLSAAGLALDADNTKKLKDLVSADNTEVIRDYVVSILPNAPKGSPSPSPASEAAKKQREALQRATEYLKNKQSAQHMITLQTYTVPADEQFDASRLHAKLPQLQEMKVFNKLKVYDNDGTVAEWDPMKPDEALKGKTLNKYEFSCHDGKLATPETITITYDVDQHEFVVAATEEESLLASFIKMAQLAKESGHQMMRIEELPEDSSARSDAWIAIKLVGLNPWPEEEPQSGDQDRYEELHKQLLSHAPSVRLGDPKGSPSGAPGSRPRRGTF